MAYLEEKAKVIKAMDPITKLGQIKVGTETWSAKAEGDVLFQEGEIVKIDAIEGVKAIISKI